MNRIKLRHFLIFSSCLLQVIYCGAQTSVSFTTSDSVLQKIYNAAVQQAHDNIITYGDRRVMKEGAKYVSLWLETQAMGGYMYAKRDLEIARNNIEIFMDYQREDGRLPGVIYNRNGTVEPNYVQFQGFYFPMPAFELYFLLDKDTAFLKRLYNCLKKFDAYLWKTRDSDHNGCLETWCLYDTGEDNSLRFNGFPNGWAFDYAPTDKALQKLTPDERRKYAKQEHYDSTKQMVVPIESMDIMSYSYSCRHVLSLISKEMNNGEEQLWKQKAADVTAKIKSYLWDENKKACFDKDKNNKVMPVLLHNNLRCMYFGSFTQQMADDFVKYHLMNPKDFWTKMPLPSTAVSDPLFRNIEGNNWSGQPQGLTFQRSISALENYGHYAELTLIGKKLLGAIADSVKFTQQFDPFTGKPNNSKDGYGPTILATLEFISRFYGVHITQDHIYWSCVKDAGSFTYTQQWNGYVFKQQSNDSMVNCFINDKLIGSFSKGARVITDIKGNVLKVAGIDPRANTVTVEAGKKFTIQLKPNQVYAVDGHGQLVLVQNVPFSKAP